jgi:hypothetical protein
LYSAVVELIAILNDRECTTAYTAFTPLYCRKISWAVYIDCRHFFSQKLCPANFRSNVPKYARARLRDIHSDVLYQKPIYRSSFPIAWDAKPKAKPGEVSTGATVGNQGGGEYQNKLKTGGVGNIGGGDGGGGCQGNGNVNPAYAHVHPKIRKMMSGLYEKFEGKVRIQEIMERNAGLTWESMPTYQDVPTGSREQHVKCAGKIWLEFARMAIDAIGYSLMMMGRSCQSSSWIRWWLHCSLEWS